MERDAKIVARALCKVAGDFLPDVPITAGMICEAVAEIEGTLKAQELPRPKYTEAELEGLDRLVLKPEFWPKSPKSTEPLEVTDNDCAAIRESVHRRGGESVGWETIRLVIEAWEGLKAGGPVHE